MIVQGLIDLLKADTAVEAIVADRIYTSVLPRDYQLPAIALHRYGGIQDYDFDGPVGVREDQVQVDAYAKTAGDTQVLAEAIRAALVSYVGALPGGTVVEACYLERVIDMPYLPNANTLGIANRTSLSFRVVSQQG